MSTTKAADSSDSDRVSTPEETTDASASGQQVKKGASVLKKVSEALEVGVQAIKTGAKKVIHKADETAKTAKLKMEIHQLENELRQVHRHIGRQVWEAQKAGQLEQVETALAEAFSQAEALDRQMEEKAAEMARLAAE